MVTRLLAVLALAFGLFSGAAHASIIYSITGTLAGGGTVSGTFTTNDTRTAVTAANISVTAQGNFAAVTYTLAGSTLAQSLPSQYFQITNAANDILRVYFSNVTGLTATGGTVALNSSYDSQPSSGNRLFTSATVALAPATPEPSSLVLLGTGLLSAVGVARRRFKIS